MLRRLVFTLGGHLPVGLDKRLPQGERAGIPFSKYLREQVGNEVYSPRVSSEGKRKRSIKKVLTRYIHNSEGFWLNKKTEQSRGEKLKKFKQKQIDSSGTLTKGDRDNSFTKLGDWRTSSRL